MYGQGSVGQGCMTGPGRGFWTSSVMMSPSSGSYTTLYGTNDEWSSEFNVEGFQNMNAMSFIPWASESSVFFYFFYPITIGSIRTSGEGVEIDWLGSYSGGRPVLAPISDSTCLIATRQYSQFTRIERRVQGQFQVVHEFDAETPWVEHMSFADTEFGAIVGTRPDGSRSIQVSSNGGENWTTVYADTLRFRQLVVPSTDTVWVAGDHGVLMRSSDGGANWEHLVPPRVVDLASIAVCTWDSVWVSGVNGYTAVTGNGGNTWVELPIPSNRFYSLKAVPGMMYATADGALYRYAVRQVAAPSAGWRQTDHGIELLFSDAGSSGSVSLVDLSGRVIRDGGFGPYVFMTGLAEGVYVVRAHLAEREERVKVFWSGQ